LAKGELTRLNMAGIEHAQLGGGMRKNDGEGAVSEAFRRALNMMNASGYGISESIVSMSVDPKLQFMGYTNQEEGGMHRIVVAGFAVGSGMLEGLLLHEMSHVYRTISKHPSHDFRLIDDQMQYFLNKGAVRADFQKKALFEVVNHIEDLYADDAAIRVMRENIGASGLPSLRDVSQFFQSMVKDTPVHSKNALADSWANASIMLDNASALSSMKRHSIEDIDERARKLNQRFLSQIAPEAANQFGYFSNLMSNLPENIDRRDFQTLLHEYIERFLGLVKVI
jgi:Family of unknown function (DUF5781)